MGHASKMPRQKGCHLCKPHKHRDAGQSHRKPFTELRRLGKLRRVSRHDLGDALGGDRLPRAVPDRPDEWKAGVRQVANT